MKFTHAVICYTTKSEVTAIASLILLFTISLCSLYRSTSNIRPPPPRPEFNKSDHPTQFEDLSHLDHPYQQ
jgi:hypothetical protein